VLAPASSTLTTRLQIVALAPFSCFPGNAHSVQVQWFCFLETLLIYLSGTIAVVHGHWDRGNEVYMAEVRPSLGRVRCLSVRDHLKRVIRVQKASCMHTRHPIG
jgi:hypothetical protein